MEYFDFDFERLEGDSYLGSAHLHIEPARAENYKNVFVSNEGHIDEHVVDCFTIMEFFPDDYGMTYFRGSGKKAGVAEEPECEISVSGYMRYVSYNTAMLDGIEYFERAVIGDDYTGADSEYRIVVHEEIYGEIGFLDERTILFQNDFMDMVMRTPKEVTNIFEYQILRTPEAV